jgi:hypothetical protein
MRTHAQEGSESHLDEVEAPAPSDAWVAFDPQGQQTPTSYEAANSYRALSENNPPLRVRAERS